MEPALGGFVTSKTFNEAVSQAKEPKAKPKAALKRKLGQRITRNASTKAATDAAPEPAAKRRRLQPNAFPFPPSQDPQDPFGAGPQDRTEEEDDFDLYVTYDSAF